MIPYYFQTKQLENKHGYEIIDNIILVSYDEDWYALANRLETTYQPYYKPNQKYVIHHYDTEYFLGEIGLGVENFNRTIRYLDIDPCRFVIFINQYKSSQRWLSYCDNNNVFQVVETPLTKLLYCQSNALHVDPGIDCKYHFCCLMGKDRIHRDKISYFLQSNQLYKKNIVSYNRQNPFKSITTNIDFKTNKHNFEIITPVPYTRINEIWSNNSKVNASSNILENNTIPACNYDDVYHSPWYKDVMFDLVAESVFEYPHAYLSEKSFRPIVGMRPFVLAGAPESLQWLQHMGFKTFSDWWDESYDLETDADQRLLAIFSVIEEICSWSMKKCQTILKDMQPTLQYNRQIYQQIWNSYS